MSIEVGLRESNSSYCENRPWKNSDQTVKQGSADQLWTENLFIAHFSPFPVSKRMSKKLRTTNSQYIINRLERLLVRCGAVHSGCCRVSNFWAKGKPQTVSSVFSSHVAPILKIFASFYCTYSPVLFIFPVVKYFLHEPCQTTMNREKNYRLTWEANHPPHSNKHCADRNETIIHLLLI